MYPFWKVIGVDKNKSSLKGRCYQEDFCAEFVRYRLRASALKLRAKPAAASNILNLYNIERYVFEFHPDFTCLLSISVCAVRVM